jgi:hypothetical protein
MGSHALLSASSAHRWLHCTPSARVEEAFDPSTSTFAEEGTAAHALSEYKLRKFLGQEAECPQSRFDRDEMDFYTDVYVDYAIDLMTQARKTCSDAIVLLEQRLDFSEYVKEGFGTGDLIIVANGILEVVDLKYGKGIVVSADNNPQMKLYALGALGLFDSLYDIQQIRMTIVQPRLENISVYEISADALTLWATTELMEKAQLAWAGEGEFAPSEYTCKFCRAKASCRARAEKNMQLARFDFKPAPLLSKDEITAVLSQANELDSWCKDIWSWAEAKAIAGEAIDGFKIVEGRSNRVYSSESAVIERLQAKGYSDEEIFIKGLKGITALEKQLSRKVFSEVLEGLIIKPAGKYTMVPESDKREAVTTAKADFEKEM